MHALGKGEKLSNNAGLRNGSQPLRPLTYSTYSTRRLNNPDNWSLSTFTVQLGRNQLGDDLIC